MKKFTIIISILCFSLLFSCRIKKDDVINIEESEECYTLEKNNSDEITTSVLEQGIIKKNNNSLNEVDDEILKPEGKVLVEESNYLNRDDYHTIVNKGRKLYLYYETDVVEGKTLIKAFQYLLEDSKKTNLIGGFDFERGFYGAGYVPLNLTGDSNRESDFFNNYLLGISINLINHPFEIYGIARATDGDIYETEIMQVFRINSDTMTIEKWAPDYW